jgi:hypothetical protein
VAPAGLYSKGRLLTLTVTITINIDEHSSLLRT